MTKTLTVDYSPELFSDAMEFQTDYLLLGETVCGAEDPAVIWLGEDFSAKHPEFKGFTVVRVIDRYVSPWKSDTLLEFSNREATAEEYALSDDNDD
jgi:hypothetical protein